MYDILQLNEMLVPELRDIADRIGLTQYKKLSKQELIYKILDHQAIEGNKNTPPADQNEEEIQTTTKEEVDNKPKRRRRTKAEMEEARAEEEKAKEEKNKSRGRKKKVAPEVEIITEEEFLKEMAYSCAERGRKG